MQGQAAKVSLQGPAAISHHPAISGDPSLFGNPALSGVIRRYPAGADQGRPCSEQDPTGSTATWPADAGATLRGNPDLLARSPTRRG